MESLDLKTRSHVRKGLFNNGREFHYERNDLIIRSGDTPSGVYYIESGWVQAFTICDDGEINIVFTLYPGDIFPLAWAATGVLHDINFSALSETTVLRITRDDYAQALSTSQTVVDDTLNLLSKYSYCFTEELENLQYRTAKQRVCYRLYVLASHFGKRTDKGIVIDQAVSNEYIARSTNMTRETASREMTNLARQQIVNLSGNHIVIANAGKLRQALPSDYLQFSEL
jgi:CRP-like cAMP-binding protein